VEAVSCLFKIKLKYLLVTQFQNSMGYKKECDFVLYTYEEKTLLW